MGAAPPHFDYVGMHASTAKAAAGRLAATDDEVDSRHGPARIDRRTPPAAAPRRPHGSVRHHGRYAARNAATTTGGAPRWINSVPGRNIIRSSGRSRRSLLLLAAAAAAPLSALPARPRPAFLSSSTSSWCRCLASCHVRFESIRVSKSVSFGPFELFQTPNPIRQAVQRTPRSGVSQQAPLALLVCVRTSNRGLVHPRTPTQAARAQG